MLHADSDMSLIYNHFQNLSKFGSFQALPQATQAGFAWTQLAKSAGQRGGRTRMVPRGSPGEGPTCQESWHKPSRRKASRRVGGQIWQKLRKFVEVLWQLFASSLIQISIYHVLDVGAHIHSKKSPLQNWCVWMHAIWQLWMKWRTEQALRHWH